MFQILLFLGLIGFVIWLIYIKPKSMIIILLSFALNYFVGNFIHHEIMMGFFGLLIGMAFTLQDSNIVKTIVVAYVLIYFSIGLYSPSLATTFLIYCLLFIGSLLFGGILYWISSEIFEYDHKWIILLPTIYPLEILFTDHLPSGFLTIMETIVKFITYFGWWTVLIILLLAAVISLIVNKRN